MEKKIRILFYNTDVAGVNYYRTLTPAMEVDKNHSDEFFVEINPNINFEEPEIINYLTSFDIIHYHKELYNARKYPSFRKALRDAGTILILDMDDYWQLPKSHPLYAFYIHNRLQQHIELAIKNADYITTTTELFAAEIRKVSGLDNVFVMPNSIDPNSMDQFQNNWTPSTDGRVRITYMGGSSHLGDLTQMEGVINILNNDVLTRDKFKMVLAGWDINGNTTEVKFNQELGKELQEKKLYNNKIIKLINEGKGDISGITQLPQELRDRYKDNVFIKTERAIEPKESSYYLYENILSDNHRIIKDKNYLTFLNKYDRVHTYPNEGNYARRWTQKVNTYANVLNETDIVIAPLADNTFNNMKSNLKQVECWTRSLPIICSDVAPYNVDGRHMENCILIPSKTNSNKFWAKYLKRLILDEGLRKGLGAQLHNDFKISYNLEEVTKARVEVYKKLLNKNESI
jgi:glycosyltransferase involved in cell wall biosynthesis